MMLNIDISMFFLQQTKKHSRKDISCIRKKLYKRIYSCKNVFCI